MRKAKITGCVVETVGIEMTNAAIGVGLKVGRYERYAHVVFDIEIAKTDIGRNINQKSELLTEHLMKHVRKTLEYWNEGDADTKSQTYALSAFQTIKEHWQREQWMARFKNHPVMHVKRQVQVTMQNFNQLQELAKEGIINEWSLDTSRTPTLSVKMSDNHTIVEDNGWLIQDTEGRWCGMDSGYHCMLEKYQKIVIEL